MSEGHGALPSDTRSADPFTRAADTLLAEESARSGGDVHLVPRVRATLDYHLCEYRSSTKAGEHHPVLSLTGPWRGRVLDIGCGFGQTLLTAGQQGDAELLVGIDRDRGMLRFGALLPRVGFVVPRPPRLLAGDALALPFRDGSFDLVVCRVVLMSVPVRPALEEMARVVKPGGALYLHLTGAGYYLQALSRGQLAGPILALGNGLLLSLAGRQVRARGLWNNFESSGHVTRVLSSRGLRRLKAVPGPRFLGLATNMKLLFDRPDGASRS